MHMADALLSPTIGIGMWAVTASSLGYSAKTVRRFEDDRTAVLMGVLGAFVFSAQMINFSIPGTGSSGHLGGGLLLAILLGPQAGLLVIASILTVQSLFFADGGMLALGANIFNLGVMPCLIAYPFIYRPLAKNRPSAQRLTISTVFAGVVGLQLGAIGVILQTAGSGITDLDISSFAWLMLPIHLAIGLIEGFVTAAVVNFIYKARPEIIYNINTDSTQSLSSRKALIAPFGIAAIVTGVVLSWYASTDPDGLEWSIAKASFTESGETPKSALHIWLEKFQERLSFLPDYGLPDDSNHPVPQRENHTEAQLPKVELSKSLSGLTGGILTLILALGMGVLIRKGVSCRSASSPKTQLNERTG